MNSDMNEAAKSIQKAIRAQAKKAKESRKKNKVQLAVKRDESGTPIPQDLTEAVGAVREYLGLHDRLYDMVRKLEALFAEDEAPKEDRLSPEEMEAMFLSGNRYQEVYNGMISMVPPTIALIALDHFFKDSERFDVIDPNSLPFAKDCEVAYQPPKLTHTTMEIAGEQVSVPMNGEFWVLDKKIGKKFIVNFGPSPQGGIGLSVAGDYDFEEEAVELIKDIKHAVLQSPYIRGRVVEVTGGSGFTVYDIGEQPEPIMDPVVREELQKNVVNLFTKQDEFKKYGLPIKRSVILCGPPGCGKTMVEKWLASQVRGKVTTLWVTSKAIRDSDDVKQVFEMARKLSPALVVMEDLDLISGTRSHMFGGSNTSPLGEMLNQLDGLTSDNAIVVVGSTNRVSSLDEALSDRPGRFDRIYEVGCPQKDLAKLIARQYLSKRGIEERVISDLNLEPLATGQFTGAQIVEIVKGAIFEAIHRGGVLSSMCIASSCRGLLEQKKLTNKN